MSGADNGVLGDEAAAVRQVDDGVGRADDIFQRFGRDVPIQFIKIVIIPDGTVYQIAEMVSVDTTGQFQWLDRFNIQVIADFGHLIRFFFAIDGNGLKRNIRPAPLAVAGEIVFGEYAEEALREALVVGNKNEFFHNVQQPGRLNPYGGQDIREVLVGGS